MSEAEKSNNNPSLFEFVPPASEPVEPESLAEEWTTVDFPNALPVDEIPHESPAIPDQSELLQSLNDHIQQLEQQNQDLCRQKDDLIGVLEKQDQEFHAQIANLTKALQQTRNMLRLERRNWESQATQIKRRSHEQTAHIAQQTQELTATQEQIVKLFREIEQSQQIAQRQQILVETLTHQLEASQEQVAQLERECAVTQQRYTDQTQLVHQTENACKDLRSRLLRQQRYTMQFKTALEKCLDVPAAKSVESLDDLSLNLKAPLRQDGIHRSSDLLAPKAQPVQPWSAQPEFLELDPLLEDPQSIYIPSPWDEESTLSEADDLALPPEIDNAPIVEEPFEVPVIPVVSAPKVAPPKVSYTIQRSPVSEHESSLSPEIELFTPDERLPVDEDPAEELTQPDQTAIAVELDLDQKLEEALQAFEAPADFVAAADFAGSLQDDQDILNEIHAIEETASPEQEPDLFEPVAPLPEVTQLNSSELAPSSSPFVTLGSGETQPSARKEVTGSEMPLVASGLSPIVYPLRSSKKLKSLAAVDLPSFPRSSK